MVWLNCCSERSAYCADKAGSTTVAMAMLNTPSGNSISRSAYQSQLTLPLAGRKEAMMESSIRLICATEEPNMIGSIILMMRLTRGSCQAQRGRGSRPRAISEGNWNNSCTMPATNTAIASDSAEGAYISAAAIRQTFSHTGVKAGTAKRP